MSIPYGDTFIQNNYITELCQLLQFIFNEFPLENSATQMTIMVRSRPGTSIWAPILTPEHVLGYFP